MSDKSRRYLPSLDGTPGIFAFVVLAGHYGYARMGWIALDYSFVLSGYLITSILLGEKNRSFDQYAARFYWRRILRTFPPYFGFLLLCGVFYVWLGQPVVFPRFFLVGAATVGVAHLSYVYFERRFLDLKDRFAKRDVGLVAATNPTSPLKKLRWK